MMIMMTKIMVEKQEKKKNNKKIKKRQKIKTNKYMMMVTNMKMNIVKFKLYDNYKDEEEYEQNEGS